MLPDSIFERIVQGPQRRTRQQQEPFKIAPAVSQDHEFARCGGSNTLTRMASIGEKNSNQKMSSTSFPSIRVLTPRLLLLCVEGC